MRFKRASILAFLVWAFSFAAQAQPAPQSDSDKAPTILACFHAGQTAIRDLRACAQAWLTPKALLLCELQNAEAGKAGPIACPFLPDTPNGRAILDTLLAQQHLTRDSNLSLDTRNFPDLPERRHCGRLQQDRVDAAGFPRLYSDVDAPRSKPGASAMYRGKRIGYRACLVSCEKRDGRSGSAGRRQMFSCARRRTRPIYILPRQFRSVRCREDCDGMRRARGKFRIGTRRLSLAERQPSGKSPRGLPHAVPRRRQKRRRMPRHFFGRDGACRGSLGLFFRSWE